ncbi:MAG: phosphoribosyl-ATP diphosphatase [Angelakisella sp.]
MNDTISGLYEVIEHRKSQPQEGSYTCYLFEQGLDKILKKCAEEAGEVIIAAKNGENAQTAEEICDLVYHLLVLMSQQNLPLSQVEGILEQRRQKLGNLKQLKNTDRLT